MIGTKKKYTKIMEKISLLERNIHGKWFVYRFVIQAKKKAYTMETEHKKTGIWIYIK